VPRGGGEAVGGGAGHRQRGVPVPGTVHGHPDRAGDQPLALRHGPPAEAVTAPARPGALPGAYAPPPLADFGVFGGFAALSALAAAFISCLCARILASDSGPVMSAAEQKDFSSP